MGGNILVPKIAAAFGGGIGRCGSVCGALTGGVMAKGIKYGTNEPSAEKRLRAYELARKAYRRFEKRHGSVLCREALEKARNAEIFEEKCTGFIRATVEILMPLDEN